MSIFLSSASNFSWLPQDAMHVWLHIPQYATNKKVCQFNTKANLYIDISVSWNEKYKKNIKSCSNQIHAKAAVTLFLPPDISRKSSSLVSYPDPESMMSWPWMTPWNVTTKLQQHNHLQHLSDFSWWHVDKRIFCAVRVYIAECMTHIGWTRVK